MGTLDKAIAIAARAHFGQRDKAGAPYVLHPLRAMFGLFTPEERIVGVLHDVVEDTSVTVGELRAEGFSDDVLTALDAVTKREGEEHMDFVARAGANPIGRRVKLVDLADNCDLSRTADPTMHDLDPIKKYRRAIHVLTETPQAASERPEPLADARRAS